MALSFTLKEGVKYVIGGLTGTGVTLAMLLAWTGAEDLDAIKTAVNQTVNQSNAFTQEMSSSYLVEINKANAEIEDYQEALDQANANILEEKPIGQRELAYEVKKFTTGYYYLFVVEADAAAAGFANAE